MTYLLVPGAGGDPWYWHRLVPLLDRAVAVRLPADDDTAGLAAYADAIVAAAPPDEPVTVVAQSMGGLSAPLVCGRLDVRRLVLVNAMVPRPGETGGEWWAATGQAEAMQPGFDIATHFFHDVPEAVTREAFSAEPPRQSDRPFVDPWPLAAWPDVPTDVVAGADDRFFPPDFQRRVAAERLGVDVDLVPGGHLVALSRPAELAAYLRGRAPG